MDVLIILAALALLILFAYRGFSVILLAPAAAMLAVLLTNPIQVAPSFSAVYLEALGTFIKVYLPVFLLGAVFGKLMELAGFAASIANATARLLGPERAIAATVTMTAIMTYGGVSVFVAVFAVYPFAAALFRNSNVPKRLLPATFALGAFTFSMDALPGSPQVQNIIPTAYFHTTAWAAPILGIAGAAFILVTGLVYLEYLRRRSGDEGYGHGHLNEHATSEAADFSPVWLAALPLVVVLLSNLLLTELIPQLYGSSVDADLPGMKNAVQLQVAAVTGMWAVEAALFLGCLLTVVLKFQAIRRDFAVGSKLAVSGALLAAVNTGSEFGFGAIIAVLPGFAVIRNATDAIADPLVRQAVAISALAGVSGSGVGGLSLALGALGDQFLAAGLAAGIPPAVLHRVAAMACGGLDTLPHNGGVITLLMVCGLTHRQSYKPIFGLTCLKTIAVFVVIGIHYATGLV